MQKIFKNGARSDGSDQHLAIRSVLQYQARDILAGKTGMTDNSSGTPDTGFAIVNVAANLTNQAASGSDLATAASTLTGLTAVLDALREIYAQTKTLMDFLGMTGLTAYNAGGAAPDLTIGAISATTGGSTGAQIATVNPEIAALNDATYTVANLLNKLCVATGVSPLVIGISNTSDGAGFKNTVAAITLAAGSNADPGIKKADIDLKLAAFANNIATMHARLAAIVSTTKSAPTYIVG